MPLTFQLILKLSHHNYSIETAWGCFPRKRGTNNVTDREHVNAHLPDQTQSSLRWFTFDMPFAFAQASNFRINYLRKTYKMRKTSKASHGHRSSNTTKKKRTNPKHTRTVLINSRVRVSTITRNLIFLAEQRTKSKYSDMAVETGGCAEGGGEVKGGKKAKIYQNTKFSLVIQAETLSHRKWTKWRREQNINIFYMEIWSIQGWTCNTIRIFVWGTRQEQLCWAFSSFIFIHIVNEQKNSGGKEEYDRKLSLSVCLCCCFTSTFRLCTNTEGEASRSPRRRAAKNISVHTTISLHHEFVD